MAVWTGEMQENKGTQEFPVWFDPLSPLGSAARYLAGFSPHFDWVGIYELKGSILELGSSFGEASRTKSELVVLVRDPSGQVVGQIDIDSHESDAFGPDEERVVRKIAKELGELWPEPGKLNRR